MWDKPLLAAAVKFCGRIWVILRLSPHRPNEYLLLWLYHDNPSPMNEQKTLNVLNSKSFFFVHMHLITVKIGVIMSNRHFFIYLDGSSIGVSLDISRHTLLKKIEINVIMIDLDILSILCDIKLLFPWLFWAVYIGTYIIYSTCRLCYAVCTRA